MHILSFITEHISSDASSIIDLLYKANSQLEYDNYVRDNRERLSSFHDYESLISTILQLFKNEVTLDEFKKFIDICDSQTLSYIQR